MIHGSMKYSAEYIVLMDFREKRFSQRSHKPKTVSKTTSSDSKDINKIVKSAVSTIPKEGNGTKIIKKPL